MISRIKMVEQTIERKAGILGAQATAIAPVLRDNDMSAFMVLVLVLVLVPSRLALRFRVWSWASLP
jgi:hypothetical protein